MANINGVSRQCAGSIYRNVFCAFVSVDYKKMVRLNVLSKHLKNVDNGTWFVDTISVQLDVPGVGWYNSAQPPAVLRYYPRC